MREWVELFDLPTRMRNARAVRGIMRMRSPSIFTTSLRQQCLGLSINGLFLGAFSHADGIRTSATNIQDVRQQK